MYTLTRAQRLWLSTRGGRTLADVFEFNGSPCVFMRDQGENVPVEIPADHMLQIVIRKKGTSMEHFAVKEL